MISFPSPAWPVSIVHKKSAARLGCAFHTIRNSQLRDMYSMTKGKRKLKITFIRAFFLAPLFERQIHPLTDQARRTNLLDSAGPTGLRVPFWDVMPNSAK